MSLLLSPLHPWALCTRNPDEEQPHPSAYVDCPWFSVTIVP